MDKKRKIVLISAIVLGVFAVLLVNNYLQQLKQQDRRPPPAKPTTQQQERTPSSQRTAEVLVARTNIKRSANLSKRMFAFKNIPIQYAQPGVATSDEEIEGKVALVAISRGEQLLLNKIGSLGEEAELTFSMKVPTGKRAVTIVVGRISAAGGMIKPGDYVDVFCSIPFVQEMQGKAVESIITASLFQKVLVLRIRSLKTEVSREKSAIGKVSITLALTPPESALLLFAENQGQISFVLRAPLDTEVGMIPPVSVGSLIQQVSGMPQMQQPQLPPSDADAKQADATPQGIEVFEGINKK